MTPERWERIGRILDRALEAEPADRPTVVRDLAGGDDALAREVLEHVAAFDRWGETLDRPVTVRVDEDGDLPVARLDLAGRRVDRYRLVRRIGEGGMGTVYEAERADRAFEKRVAIKLLPLADRERIVEGFRRERQILAGLEHPNVARLLDGGITEDGVPYFVMELVEGEPIDRWCARKGLSIRRRVELFQAVCEAVEYAHRNLIVHRDLKPGNVLVDEDGLVKLLDFGVARLLDPVAGPSPLTRLGGALTPPYASPEQIRGEPVSTASDVYSLGVMLYELLAGRRPFEAGDSPAEIARLADAPVARPSERVDGAAWGEAVPAVRRTLAGDLDRIILVALRKEPERRYPSVERLRNDLRRWLDGLPVSAGPDTLGYRVSKFVGRHRAGVAAGTAGAAALAAAVVGALWQARRADRAAGRATVERNKAEEVAGFLRRMLASVDPSLDGRDVKVAEVLDRAGRRVDDALADQPEVAATVHATLGKSYGGLGLYGQAETHARKALDLRRRTLPPDDPEIAAALRELGQMLRLEGSFEEAERCLEEAVAAARERGDPARLDLAQGLTQLGVLMSQTGREPAAERIYREALEIFDHVPSVPEEWVAVTLNDLGVVVGNRGEAAEAERIHRRALEIMERVHGTRHPDYAYTLYNVAGALDIQGRHAEALRLYDRTLEIRREVLGEDHPLTILSAVSVAHMHRMLGENEEAVRLAQEATARARVALPENHPWIAYALSIQGFALLNADRPAEAEPALREAVEIRSKTFSPNHWLTANVESALGEALVRQGRAREGRRLLRRAHRTLRADRGPRHEMTRDARRRLRTWGRGRLRRA